MTPADAPLVLGIAGPSGSGKSSIANALAEQMPDALVFGLDSYYLDQRGVPEEQVNVDVPEALDFILLYNNLRALADGRTIVPKPVVVVEGLYALYWAELRALYTSSIFVMLDHDECLKRRIARDAQERGRSQTTVRLLYEEKVRPMYDRHVHPTRAHADISLDGRRPLATLVQQVRDSLPR